MRKLTITILSVALVAAFSAASALAKTKPTVVIIRADWCTACQKLEPMMMDLMKEYEGKLNFVILDVTNEETTAKAAAKAKSLGLSRFFEANKKMTSTVAIFKGRKQVFKTVQNFDRYVYVAAFDKAIKGS
jgi:thiol-disulfide isomerase/thioredoxin